MYHLLLRNHRSNPAASKSKLEDGGPPITLHAARKENVRRAIAIVVDDFSLSFESIARLRSALEKFIEEQTLNTDLMAVIRTSGGPGAIQQFTSNRTQIMATIKHLQWYATGRGGMSAVTSFSPIDNNENGVEIAGYSSSRPPDLSSKEYSGGSLGSLDYVIQGLSRFPGRKSIVLISENLPLTKEAQINGVTKELDRLIDLANRNSIVISTIDARGLRKAGLTADDSQTNLAANQIKLTITRADDEVCGPTGRIELPGWANRWQVCSRQYRSESVFCEGGGAGAGAGAGGLYTGCV